MKVILLRLRKMTYIIFGGEKKNDIKAFDNMFFMFKCFIKDEK